MENLLKSLFNKYRVQIGIFLVAVVFVGGGVLALTTGRSKSPEIEKMAGAVSSSDEPSETTVSGASISAVLKIKIDVAGAVVNPGVYELFEDSRVEEALNAAGGLAEGADREWVSKNLNLAAKLSDGDKLYIPKAEETKSVPSVTNEPAPVVPPSSAGIISGVETPSGGSLNCSRVNINTASVSTLDDCLPGIGPAYAQRIVEYRESHSGFKSIEEIQEVSGIGPKTFEKLKDQIVVD